MNIRRLWILFLARFRMSNEAICEASRGLGLYDDYHDWPDGDGINDPFPWHFHTHTCKRCGKRFCI